MTEYINLKFNILFSKENIRRLLRIIDPAGVSSRNVIAERRQIWNFDPKAQNKYSYFFTNPLNVYNFNVCDLEDIRQKK